ncbi:unnamed protein product [Arctia plantaginis]|uniref:Uncharacterized protein n=1 Tax=Arctia plantaginis TaxID=874455 RepID=A0A8S1BB80_ARCPL|nr:unnamed protein product [Arctia plantaginis]
MFLNDSLWPEDIIALQETWLYPYVIPIRGTINEDLAYTVQRRLRKCPMPMCPLALDISEGVFRVPTSVRRSGNIVALKCDQRGDGNRVQ